MSRVPKIVLLIILFSAALLISGPYLAEAQKTKSLEKVFNEPSFGYTIAYPSDWVYTIPVPNIVVFAGQKKQNTRVPTVSIRNLNSTKIQGGMFKDIDDVIKHHVSDLTVQAVKNVKIYNTEPYVYEKGGTKLFGKQFLAEYTFQEENYKQLLVIVLRRNGDIFHTWSYTSPAKNYDRDLGIARAMLASWTLR